MQSAARAGPGAAADGRRRVGFRKFKHTRAAAAAERHRSEAESFVMDLIPLPFCAGLEEYQKQAKGLLEAFESGDPASIHRIRQHHAGLPDRANSNDRDKLTDSEIRSAEVSLADARCVVACCYGFENWPKLTEFVEAVVREGSAVAQFESAVEAIIAGDVGTLGMLLRENPELVRMRSLREHGATLLLYVGANLVEGYRQKSPRNAVDVATVLLEAGADIDAAAITGGNGTTLGQIATSGHTARAGVQIALLETLLNHGASSEGAPNGYRPLTAALANGCGEAAELLAKRGARLDLEGAAGVGRLDVVQSFFDDDGKLKGNATKAQMEAGFQWACEYGRNDVVEFLLDHGMDLQAGENIDETGLHWAAIGGHVDTIELLLQRGARLEARNCYGGTVLGQATWSAMNDDGGIDYVPVIKTLLDAGAMVEEADYPTGNQQIDEMLRHYGAKP
jgi:ankyrin repeat protein